jgi:ABC-type nitrate/sulfonate/bicarbonate transport system substrate-binding protein
MRDEVRSVMLRRITVTCILVLATLGTALPAGCGTSEVETDEITLQLNWFHAAEFVGYYMADAKGFYADENLDVTIVEGGPGIQARLHVLDGRADFAISSFAEQQGLVEAGEPTVAVMSVFQIPPIVLFGLAAAGIEEPGDLVGKRVGIKNSYWQNIVYEVMTNAGIDVSQIIEVDVEADAQSLLYQGDVDVWTGYAHDEPVRAQVAGYEVANIYAADYGVGGYEGLLLVNEAMVEQESDTVGRFVRTSLRGLEYALLHPDEAADILAVWQPEDGVGFHRLAVRALIPLVDTPQAAIGSIDDERWAQLMGPAFDAQNPGYTMEFIEEAP